MSENKLDETQTQEYEVEITRYNVLDPLLGNDEPNKFEFEFSIENEFNTYVMTVYRSDPQDHHTFHTLFLNKEIEYIEILTGVRLITELVITKKDDTIVKLQVEMSPFSRYG